MLSVVKIFKSPQLTRDNHIGDPRFLLYIGSLGD